jgi:hypothetical protein
MKKRGSKKVQVSLTLPAEQLAGLERLACRISDTNGKRLAVNAILRSIIKLYLELGIEPTGVKSEEELFTLLMKALGRK